MLTPAEALQRILGLVTPLTQTESAPLEQAVGRVLARAAHSDVDLPPFDKSAMDGFAVRSADFGPGQGPEGVRELRLVGESRAGAPFDGEVGPGECAAIYTGAELPRGADAVVIVEQSRELPGGLIRLEDRPKSGQHLCRRASDLAVGMQVLEPGRRVRAVDLALLAAVGCEPVPVVRRPRVAVLTSGDELVPPTERPGRGQIREGNTLHLAAMARAAGAEVVLRGVVRDDEAELERTFADALGRCDALLTTGGVSMGKYDLVGAALERCGVRGEFHKVAIKPGKPLWFGLRGSVPVFALPGNPVSAYTCLHRYVLPALDLASGLKARELQWVPLGATHIFRPKLACLLPVKLANGPDGVTRALPRPGNTSGDLAGLVGTDGFVELPAEEAEFPAGTLTPFRPW